MPSTASPSIGFRVKLPPSAPSSLNFGVEPLQFHAGVFDAELPATPILGLEGALAKCTNVSAGKQYATTGAKIGNAYLQRAFSEAAVLFLGNHPPGQKYLARFKKNTSGQGLDGPRP